MDQRIREHAEILTTWCTDIKQGDRVIIKGSEQAQDLIVALHEKIGERGGQPITLYQSEEAQRAYLKNHDGDFETMEHMMVLMEHTDVYIRISSDPNLMAMSDVSGEKLADLSTANKPILEERLSKRWVGTQHPTNAQAQLAGMSLEEYRNFVYDAILRDWEEVHDRQETLRERLDETAKITIKGPGTDLSLNIDGMIAVNSAGKHNMPSGEVFTAPVPDSVEGTVLFDKPLIHKGREMNGVQLRFQDGTVVEYAAEQNEAVLTDLLNTDEGARRLGEIGIGTNRGIDRFTKNMLFDEKMGDTIHLALGRAYKVNVGEGKEQNQSAVHVDMIKDMSEGVLRADGETLLDHGQFPWDE